MKHALLAVAALAFASLLSAGAASAQSSAPTLEGPANTGPAMFRPYSLDEWEVTGRLYAGYDENVNFVADGDPVFNGETDSPVIGFTGTAAYRTNLPNGFTVGASLRFDQTFYLGTQDHLDEDVNDDAGDYNLTAVSAAGYVERNWTVRDLRRRLGASYEFVREDADISAIPSNGHYLTLYGEFEPNFRTSLGADLTVGSRDFDVRFGGNPDFQRDGEYYALKFHGRFDLDGRRRSVGAYVQASRNDADGPRFRYDAVAVGITPTFQIRGPLWLYLEASAERRDYDGAPEGVPRTEQTLVRTSAQLVWAINRRWSADATVARLDVGSNDRFYEGDRTSVLFGIQVRY